MHENGQVSEPSNAYWIRSEILQLKCNSPSTRFELSTSRKWKIPLYQEVLGPPDIFYNKYFNADFVKKTYKIWDPFVLFNNKKLFLHMLLEFDHNNPNNSQSRMIPRFLPTNGIAVHQASVWRPVCK